MSIFGQPPGQGSNASGNSSPSSVYGRGDLQAAFNWLVNQPEHIRKQASDPDRLMTLYYRSSGRPEMIRAEFTRNETARIETARMESPRIETEAPVSGQNFISDLRQINEAMRQFDGPTAQATVHHHAHAQTQQHAQSMPQQQPLAPQTAAPNAHHASQAQQPHYPQPAPYQGYQNAPQSYVPATMQAQPLQHHQSLPPQILTGRTQSILAEVREKLNLSSDAEALNILVTLGHRSLKPLLG